MTAPNLAKTQIDVKTCPYHQEQLQELWIGRLDCESCVLESARESSPYDSGETGLEVSHDYDF